MRRKIYKAFPTGPVILSDFIYNMSGELVLEAGQKINTGHMTLGELKSKVGTAMGIQDEILLRGADQDVVLLRGADKLEGDLD